MAANEVHKDDIGTIFRLTISDGSSAVDISGATTKQIKFHKPSGTTETKAGTFTTDGTDGKLQYTTVSGDLDETGKWRIQAYLVLAAWTGHTDQHEFEVCENL